MRPRENRSRSTAVSGPDRYRVPTALLAVVVALGAASCGGATQISSDDDTVRLEGQTQQQSIELGELHLTADVPTELGSPRHDDRTGDCPVRRSSFSSIPVGSTDHDPKTFFSTTDSPCPDAQSLNGSFPTWASVDDLPADAVELDAPLQAPLKSAYEFKLDYTQCTNECYSRTYDVVFVTLDSSGQTFWMQSTDLDDAAADAILQSVSVA